MPKIVHFDLINRYHDDPLAGHFGVNITRILIGQKYYWPCLKKDVKSYVKECDVCFASKTVRHKPYSDLQSLPIPTHQWKNFLIDFVIWLLISTNLKGDNYDSILVMVDWLTKMVYYKSVKIIIDAPGLAEVILDMVVWHHNLPNSIASDKGSLFTSKFWSSLYYFLDIKRRLLTTFQP